ncbi:MAG TPA: hypothetical protein VM733_11525, partial [Thermoanaerobaculia bacterium]|nr:hypothetical protein [Thermoanaerobaculia bacterium]
MPLGFELPDLFGHAGPRRSRVFHRVPKRRRGVDGGEHLAARRLDISLEAIDVTPHVRVRGFLGTEGLGGRLAIARRAGGCLAPGFELDARGLPPCVERANFRFDVGGRGTERLDLLLVERDLLLEPADLELARVRRLAGGRRAAVRLHEFEPQPL